MPYDFDTASKNVIAAIQNMSKIEQSKAKLKENVLTFKLQQQMGMDEFREKQEYKNPWQRQMETQMQSGQGIPGMDTSFGMTSAGPSMTVKPKKTVPGGEVPQRMWRDPATGRVYNKPAEGESISKQASDLRNKAYVDKYNQRQTLLSGDLTKKPIKDVAQWQLFARAKKGYAAMNDATTQTVEDIKTYQDLKDFADNVNLLQNKGVDVDALEEYYKDELNELAASDLLKK